MRGESSRASLTVPGSVTKTPFGVVVQEGPPPAAFAAVHPAGGAGAERPKFS